MKMQKGNDKDKDLLLRVPPAGEAGQRVDESAGAGRLAPDALQLLHEAVGPDVFDDTLSSRVPCD